MEILIPNPERKRALILVDLQKGFVNEENEYIIPRIQAVLREVTYDLVIESTFSAGPGSLWEQQVDFTFPDEPTIDEIAQLLGPSVVKVKKRTKSAKAKTLDILREVEMTNHSPRIASHQLVRL